MTISTVQWCLKILARHLIVYQLMCKTIFPLLRKGGGGHKNTNVLHSVIAHVCEHSYDTVHNIPSKIRLKEGQSPPLSLENSMTTLKTNIELFCTF